jgi:hypothetical protein
MKRETRLQEIHDQMDTYSKKRNKTLEKIYHYPFAPESGDEVFVIDTLKPGEKIKAKICMTRYHNKRKEIEILFCPECQSQMHWNKNWEAFKCTNHEKPKFYELAFSEEMSSKLDDTTPPWNRCKI